MKWWNEISKLNYTQSIYFFYLKLRFLNSKEDGGNPIAYGGPRVKHAIGMLCSKTIID